MSIDLPGFADPVAESQATFRVVLEAMARPGRLCSAGGGLTPPPPLHPATAAVLLTLVDAETSFHAVPEFAAVAEWIAFHCGPAPADRGIAEFVLTASADFAALNTGTDEAPEIAATVILQLPALGSGRRYRLAGPGLAAPTDFAASGLGENFVERWAANHALFPRGIDLILCSGTALAALPRSVAVAEG
jgi:alpha-D-ribose 1-methylphosphonate 5-triphosphate synthase subunit PhnH